MTKGVAMHAHAMPNWFAMAGHRGRGRPHRRPHGRHGFGPPFGPGFGGFGPRGPRARRGDVRAALLVLLAEEPRNGYGLMQEIEARSNGAWRPSPGSVYPALSQLEDEGLVRARHEGGRKLFDLTEEGRSHVSEHADELGTPWEDVGGGEPIGELRTLVFSVGGAVMQVVQAGSAEQVAQAAKVLEETRRSLYRILAGDDREDDDDTPPAAA
jgi:DNA-binding PadR family transcriptional regulator